MAGVLDSGRFRCFIAEELQVSVEGRDRFVLEGTLATPQWCYLWPGAQRARSSPPACVVAARSVDKIIAGLTRLVERRLSRPQLQVRAAPSPAPLSFQCWQWLTP